ncbi:Uncharacterized conserved protein [Mycobacteroides abscessus subsp. massiliense]|uniref:YqcI/YcgG family protein n=2 Tax=Mycobacteroides abscessus TaxID=36809 RepID=UPI0009A7964A|nr:Uncharacterized conserved protein [Mycobacteroides abscessus subsp. massiliense]SLI17009.1 Uncharacterized conserved protein [Mycobacteroides abscessus subsp. massiliense]
MSAAKVGESNRSDNAVNQQIGLLGLSKRARELATHPQASWNQSVRGIAEHGVDLQLEALVSQIRCQTGIRPNYDDSSLRNDVELPLSKELLVASYLLGGYYGSLIPAVRRARIPRGRSVGSQLFTLERYLKKVGVSRDGADDEKRHRLEPSVADVSDWWPVTCSENLSFRLMASRTHCFFSRKSVSWAAPMLADPAQDWQMDLLAERLRGFTRAVKRDALDCFIATFPARYGKDVESLSVLTNTILRGLNQRDRITRRRFGRPQCPGWYFTYQGERYFVLALGGCYPNDHARHTFDSTATMLVFQPDSAFERAASSAADGRIPAATRNLIRERYRQAGMSYDLIHTQSSVESHRFVKPIKQGEPPIKWWEAPTLGRRSG